MTIMFDNAEIEGYHSTEKWDRVEARILRREYPGLNGETEVFCGRRARNITVELLLTRLDYKDADTIHTRLSGIENSVGDHGDLEFVDKSLDTVRFDPVAPGFFAELSSPVVQQVYRDCTFLGIEPASTPGREEGFLIMEDIGGALFPNDYDDFLANGGSYFTHVRLTWRQLIPGRENYVPS